MTATSQEFRRVRNSDYSRSRFGAVIGRQNRVAAHTQRIVFVALVCTCGTGARTGHFASTKLEDLTAVECVRGTDARPRAKLIDGLMELSISASLTQRSSHEYLKAMLPRRYSLIRSRVAARGQTRIVGNSDGAWCEGCCRYCGSHSSHDDDSRRLTAVVGCAGVVTVGVDGHSDGGHFQQFTG